MWWHRIVMFSSSSFFLPWVDPYRQLTGGNGLDDWSQLVPSAASTALAAQACRKKQNKTPLARRRCSTSLSWRLFFVCVETSRCKWFLTIIFLEWSIKNMFSEPHNSYKFTWWEDFTMRFSHWNSSLNFCKSSLENWAAFGWSGYDCTNQQPLRTRRRATPSVFFFLHFT